MKLLISITFALIACLSQGCATSSQTTFASPDQAVKRLVDSVRTNDRAQLKLILGPRSGDVVDSGDAVADGQAAQHFLAAYDRKHQLVSNDNGSMTLEIGNSDWPLPIPIVKDDKDNKWYFDTGAAREEIIARRIGRNELDAIQTCMATIDAEREYAQRDPNGDGIPEYAQHFISDPGKRNGLYWETAQGEQPSPLGPAIAKASTQGYKFEPGKSQPYHGYYYRILTSQGANAAGGAYDYIVDGKMIGGVALIAWPAQYGNSGVMSFIVNQDEVVYQTNLGADTAKVAASITSFDPDADWKKAQ